MQKIKPFLVLIVNILSLSLVLFIGNNLITQKAKAANALQQGVGRIFPADMTSYWELNETSGSAYIDSIESKNGACSGACPTPVIGIVGGGQSFNGRTTGIDVPSDASYAWGQNDSFTIELWMKADAGKSCVGPGSRYNEVMIGRDDPNSQLHWWIGCVHTTGNAIFYLGDENNGSLSLEGTQINDGLWHHIAGVRNAVKGANYLYIDGNLAATGSKIYSGGFGSTVSSLNIGWLNLSGGFHFEGILDEVAVYNRAIASDEVQQHYTNGLSGIGYWISDGGTGGSPTPTNTAIEPSPTNTIMPTATPTDPVYTSTPIPTSISPTNTSTPRSKSTSTANTSTPTPTSISPTNTSTPRSKSTSTANTSTPTPLPTFITSPPPPANCPTDIISCWQLDEANGNTFPDSAGSNLATCIGTACPAFSNGKINGGLSFDGLDDRLVVTHSASLDWMNDDSFSIAAWVKISQSCDNNPVFVGKAKGAAGGEWWLGCSAVGNNASFYLSDSNGVGFTVQGTKPINDGEWHHIMAVRDRNSNENRLYVDAVLDGVFTAAYSGHFNNTNDLSIGSINNSRFVNGAIDELALYGIAVPEKDIRSQYYLTRGYCFLCANPVRIMPVGDSITAGSNSGVTPDDPAYYIGYRRDLWNSLNATGYSVDFVGSQIGGQYYATTEGFDPDHEGHSGWRDDQIAKNIYSWLVTNPADAVLLHIGTNSLDTNPSDVETFLNEIDRYSKDVTVILARIIDRSCSVMNPPCQQSATTNTFNNNVVAMAEARIASGDKIIIVDMEDGAGLDFRLQPTGDMWDGLHPYATGYSKMHNVWFNALASFLPVCTNP